MFRTHKPNKYLFSLHKLRWNTDHREWQLQILTVFFLINKKTFLFTICASIQFLYATVSHKMGMEQYDTPETTGLYGFFVLFIAGAAIWRENIIWKRGNISRQFDTKFHFLPTSRWMLLNQYVGTKTEYANSAIKHWQYIRTAFLV